jgi:hypothetical protein
MSPNGNPTAEYMARVRNQTRADEQRAITAARAAKREADFGTAAKCVKVRRIQAAHLAVDPLLRSVV